MKITAKQAARIRKTQARSDNIRDYGRPTGPTKKQFIEAATRLINS
jgi:hypothetical protein